jgi:hypothetical protein
MVDRNRPAIKVDGGPTRIQLEAIARLIARWARRQSVDPEVLHSIRARRREEAREQ